MSRIAIHRGGDRVGEMIDPTGDTWYLEGRFEAAATAAGADFVREASALDVHITFNDHGKAIRGMLKDAATGDIATILILSLANGVLLVRRMFEKTG